MQHSQPDSRTNLNAGLLGRQGSFEDELSAPVGTTTDEDSADGGFHSGNRAAFTDFLLACFCGGRKEAARRETEKQSRPRGGSPLRSQPYSGSEGGIDGGTCGPFVLAGVGSARAIDREDEFRMEGMWTDVRMVREMGPEAYQGYQGKRLADLSHEVVAAFSEVQELGAMTSSASSEASQPDSPLSVTGGPHDDALQAAPVGFFADLLDAIDGQEIALEEEEQGRAAIPQVALDSGEPAGNAAELRGMTF